MIYHGETYWYAMVVVDGEIQPHHTTLQGRATAYVGCPAVLMWDPMP
jgi:hypothetical protein